MFCKFKISLCIFLIVALLTTPALPAGAESLETPEGLIYERFEEDIYADDPVVFITGYSGNATELTVPAEIDGAPVVSVDLQQVTTEVYPTRVVIEEGITALGALFGKNTNTLTEVVLPSTLKVIADGAFHAPTLETLAVPYSVALISDGAFAETVTLQVEAGSYAARWAKANGQPFEMIEHAPSIGDYDADGLTTSTDARLLLQQAADKIAFGDEQLAVADVDGDGEITTTDARLTLQYAVGKEAVDSLACPLTFDSPLIPREVAETMQVIVLEEDMFNSSNGYFPCRIVEEGALRNASVLIDHVNQSVSHCYEIYVAPLSRNHPDGTFVTMEWNGVYASLNNRNETSCYIRCFYNMSFLVRMEDSFPEFITE